MQLILIQILSLLNFQFFYAIMYSFMQFGVLYKLAFEFCGLVKVINYHLPFKR